MSYEVSQIETVLTAKTDQHDKALDKSEKKLTDFGKGASDAGFKSWSSKISASLTTWGSQLSVGLTLPLALLAKQIIDIGFSYEKAMNTFQAVTKSSTNEMAAAAAMAEKLGADMTLPATSAADAALAMTELAKGGFTAQQAMDAARGALQLAAAAQVSEAQAAEITANALNTFGLAASESTRVADLLAAASNASSAEITDVAQAMQQAGSSAAALHIPIQDLVTAIGEMANAGIKSSDAGTSLKTFMVALVPHTKAASAAMKELGINAFDSAGNFVGLQNVIQQAAPALARMTVEQKQHAIQAAFGTDAMRAANIVLSGGIEKFTAMSSAVNQSGAASELAAAKTKGLSGAWDGFLSQLETFGLKVFKSVSGSLEGLIRTVASAAEGFSKLDATVLRMGVVFATTAASAGPIALLIGKLMTLGPQGLAVTAVVAGAAAMSAAYSSNFGAMTKVVDDFFRLFTTNAKSFDGAGTAITKFALYAIAGLDALIETIEKVAVNIVQLGRLMVAAATGNWTSLAQIWSEGRAKLDRIDSEYLERVRQRQGQLDAIERGGAQGLMDYLRVINGEGGNRSGDAYFNGYVAADPFGKIEAFSVSKVQGLEGKLRSTGFAAGLKFGGALKDGAYNATHQSPFFMIHWLEDAAAYAQNEAPTEFGKAGSKMGEKLKSGFQSALGNINEFLGRAFGGTGTISDSIFDIIIRKFPKAAEELQKQGREFHEVNKAIELYSALLNTASGRNSEYVIKVNNALGAIVQTDKVLRSQLIPAYADLGGQIGRTTIITEEMGEAIRKSIGALVEQTIAAKQAGDAVQRLADEDFRRLSDAANDLASQLPESLNTIFDSIANASGKTGDEVYKFSNSLKGWATDILGIFSVLPKGAQDAAQKVLGTLDKWFKFGDSILNMMNRLGIEVPANMGQLIESLIHKFDFSSILNKVKSFGASLLDSLKNIFHSAAGMIAAGGALLASSFAVGGVGGKVLGIGGGALAGASIGSMIAPGIGTAIGAIGGAIFGGLFGGKKSQAQKEAEAAAKKQGELQMQSLMNSVEQGMLDTFSKWSDVADKISQFVELPRKQIRRFINQLQLILLEWVEASKEFKTDAMMHVKEVNENLGGSFDFMLSGFQLSEAIKNMQEVTDSDVAALRNSTTKLLNAIFAVMDGIELSIAKQSGKKSDRLKPVVDFITAIPNAIKAVIETPVVTDEQLASAFNSLRKFIDKYNSLATEFVGYSLSKIAKVASQFTNIFDSGKSMFEFLKLFTDYKALDDGVFVTINSDFNKISTWLDSTKTLAASWKSKAENIESFIKDMVASLGGTYAALRGIGSVTSDSSAALIKFQSGRPLPPTDSTPYRKIDKSSVVGSDTTTVYVTVQGTVVSDKDLRKFIADELDKRDRDRAGRTRLATSS